MSQIEDRASVIIGPMVLGECTTLTPEAQEDVTTWATMRSYVWEERTGTRVSAEADRTFLFAQHYAPSTVRARSAAYWDEIASGSETEETEEDGIYSLANPTSVTDGSTIVVNVTADHPLGEVCRTSLCWANGRAV